MQIEYETTKEQVCGCFCKKYANLYTYFVLYLTDENPLVSRIRSLSHSVTATIKCLFVMVICL